MQKTRPSFEKDGLGWRSPPGRRENLVGACWRRGCRSGWLGSWGRIGGGIRHQADIYATVLGTAFSCLVGVEWLVFAQSHHINLVCGDIVLGSQILDHRVGATFAESIVVFSIADRIRSTLERNDVALGVGNS